jgi:predicted DNA-binding protein (UPF0251 family)/predicted RNA-binding Zn-ribbon protein involved in translation (DUF1610 family)
VSPRPKRFRRLGQPPRLKGFKPMGVPLSMSESISIQYEEYEALRLADYEGFSHQQAAEKMDVSRPTFTRIYEKVRQKLAKAFAEGKPMIIEGGDVEFDKQWYRCWECNNVFHVPHHQKPICTSCNSENVEHLNESVKQWRRGKGWGRYQSQKHNETCLCPDCEKEIEHRKGVPCSEHRCPDCGQQMIRKN